MTKNFKKSLDNVRTSIYLIMCILFTSVIYVYFSEIFLKSSKTWPLGIAIISAIVIIDYLCRLKLTNLLLFFAIHTVLIGVTIIIPANGLDKIILTFISVSFLLMAINFWKTEVHERSKVVIDIPLSGIAAFIIIYFHSSYFLSARLSVFAYITGILYFLLFFVRDYLDKFFAYSMSSENFSQEMHTIFSTNISFIALFNVAAVFLILAANMFVSDSMFNVVGRLLHWIARKFFGFLEGFDNTGTQGEVETTPLIPDTENTDPFKVHATSSNNSSKIGGYIFNVIQVIVFIAIIIGVLFIIYSFIKQYMHRNNKTDDEIKSTEDDVIVKVKSKKSDNEKKHSLFMSNRKKVRKIFTNKVNTNTKKNNRIVLRKSYTPSQISDAISKEDSLQKENMAGLTLIYEKARYSNSEITKEDVDMAKKLI